MATPSSHRRPRRQPTDLASRGGALLLLLAAAIAVLSHCSALAAAAPADFEGFDSDDLDIDSDPLPPPPLLHPTATATATYAPRPPPPPPPAPEPDDFDVIWDEDEFEGIPSPSPSPTAIPQVENITAANTAPPPSLRSYTLEISTTLFLLAFVTNYFLGRRHNHRLALSWANHFATNNAVLAWDSPLLLQEAQDAFKFYARGRRYCKGLLAGMELVGRHDLIARGFQLVVARRDVITFEVVMNEDAMDHVVLAVVRRGEVKGMMKEARDLSRFASVIGSAPGGRRWVAEELVVVAESKEVAGDLITSVVLDQVFGEKVFDKLGKWFISLHFSDQHPGSHKKMLIFKFALPDAKNMADMTRLVTLVPYYIDLIGRYKLSSQARSKTEVARAKAAQEAYKDLQNARQEVLQKRKADRKKLVEEAEAKLIAEAIRKKR